MPRFAHTHPATPAQPPLDAPASRTRLAVARAKAMCRSALPPQTQINLVAAVNATARKTAVKHQHLLPPNLFEMLGDHVIGPKFL